VNTDPLEVDPGELIETAGHCDDFFSIHPKFVFFESGGNIGMGFSVDIRVESQKQASTSYLELQGRITLATAEMERREQEASKTKSTLYGVQQTLNGNVKENYVAMQSMNSVTGIASGIQNVFTGTLNAGNQALATRAEYVTRLNNLTTKAGQDAIMSIDQQIALEKVQGAERARLQAQFEGQKKGLVGAELQTYISKSEELYSVQLKNEEAAKKLTAANKSGASATKEAAKSAEEYAKFSQELSRLNATEAQQIKNWQDDKLAQGGDGMPGRD
jgi:hypothetical protein